MADVDPFIRTRLEAAARDFVPPEGEEDLAKPDHYGRRAASLDNAPTPIPWAFVAKLTAMVVVLFGLLAAVIVIFT